MTRLYNDRPTWLDLAHRALDATVCAAYGWTPDMADDQILEKLLALNVERFQDKEDAMRKCDVCGSTAFHQHRVEEVLRIQSQMIMVEGIPARVCDRCGDTTFDRQTTERIRRMVHGEQQPTRHVKWVRPTLSCSTASVPSADSAHIVSA